MVRISIPVPSPPPPQPIDQISPEQNNLDEIEVTIVEDSVVHQVGDTYVVDSAASDDIPPPKADFYAPPPYEVASKLPTYEEVQREKILEGQSTIPQTSEFRQPAHAHRILDINTLHADSNDDVDTSLLGTDFMFIIAFFVAFIFNWIGFLLLMCFCHTIASRYGALAGFGLSLAKWTIIVKESTDIASRDKSWLWWLIMTFGVIICIRAIWQYLSIKKGWRMLTASHQERLLFFY
ncbi:NEDD4 family-interacting protein 1 [Atheta coriaria]|uniref:NEDD4 family-interacting protein 1 n=1 Tax=Dalotia coriaria TaxID=877792 RepID=UPI0031F3EBF1